MNRTFSHYQVFLISVLTFLQFTVILDFMVLSPLGAILLPELGITTAQFGRVVSAYAWSAGFSALLSAGFADKYDRKKLLLFFYSGFIIGTILCGISDSYVFLLIARVVTGFFGGVIGSVIYAIVADVFSLKVRGRIMGFLQMAFAGATVLGLPTGLYLANHLGWHAAFLLIAGLCVVVLILIMLYMRPVDAHLAIKSSRNPFRHLIGIVSNPEYAKAFGSVMLVATGGFMLMPFASAFAVYNNGISLDDLPLLYISSGLCAIFTAPLIGILSDALGKYIVFCICSAILICSLVIYCNLDIIPRWMVMIFSILIFTTYAGRMISSSALFTAVPAREDRGAFMSINSSVNMVSGGIASLIAGSIVYRTQAGYLCNYNILGYTVSGAAILSMFLMYAIDKMVKQKITAGISSAEKQQAGVRG